MLNYLRSLLLGFVVCVSFLLPGRARASHAAGGEIVYEWVSDSTYRFYLKFYRDCSGITEGAVQRLCYFNSCNGASGNVRLDTMAFLPNGTRNAQEVSPGCPGYATRCRGGSLPGYQEIWYAGLFTLPSRCDSWTFYISISARNTSSNISGPSLYLEATLNNKDAQNSSSPYFSVKPVPYVCLNNPYTFNNGAVDKDNDSIGFEFITPRTSGTTCAATYTATPVNFTSGFSLTNPFATNNTFNFNPLTGEMKFTPSAISTNTVTVRANEYRNGKKIGSVMRDVQISVLSCNIPPTSSTLIPSSVQGGQLVNGTVEGTANHPLSFCYKISSPKATARLVVSDNHTLSAPGSSTSYYGMTTDSVTGCLSWIPTCADSGLKVFVITVKDSTCEPPGIAVTQTFTYPIYIRSTSFSNASTIICAGGSVTIQTTTGSTTPTWSVLPGGSPNSLSCSTCTKPVARPTVTTTYQAVTNISGCVSTENITVYVGDSGKVSISPDGPYVLCRGGMVDLDVSANISKPFTNLACGLGTANPGSIPQDTIEVKPSGATQQSMQNGGSTPFSGDYYSSRHQYLLRASDMRASGMHSGTLTGMAFKVSSIGKNAVYKNITISLKCTNLNAVDRNAGFIASTTRVYTATSSLPILISGGYINFTFDRPYNWDSTQNLVVDVCFTNTDTAGRAFTYYFNNSYQTTLSSYTNVGSVCNGAPATVYSTHELPQMQFFYYSAPEVDISYKWSNADFSPNDTAKHVSFYTGQSKQVYVSTFNSYGCHLSDTLDVYVPPVFEVSKDTEICAGNAAQLWARSSKPGNSITSQWFENGYEVPTTLSCSNCNEPVATPLQDVTYTVITTDSVHCSDTFNVNVIVKPTPDVRILNADTTVLYGTKLQLVADGADTYIWSPGSSLTSPNIKDPVATITESVQYRVTGYTNGCSASDTVNVTLDARDFVSIPTAFTPNGDGKNDVFRAVNLNGQWVVEFKVFNRWGLEMFSAEDNSGWDGTWKGEPQGIGVYYYLVRVASLQGNVKTFKGDVTLLR